MQHFLNTLIVFNTIGLFTLSALSAQAQIIPDSSLEDNNSIVVPNQVINNTSSDLITGGSTRGSILFHSFQQFNIGTNQGAYFSNPEGITNIISRVTGSSPSRIFGKLGVLGDANLFFINPNGIVFGAGASLDLKGSFLASTASSIKFSDGSEFSAEKPQAVPLLTINVPFGLNFTSNSGSIEVQGVGHTLSGSADGNVIQGAGASVTGLRVQPGKTIGLIGGNIIFDRGIVTIPDGKIEISSIGVGQVKINPQTENWIFDYSPVQSFQDIRITNLSLLDASGINGGNISIQGNQVTISNASYALIQSLDSKIAGNITINAPQSFSMIGNTSSLDTDSFTQAYRNRTGVITQNFSGKGASINILTKDLLFQFAAGVVTNSFVSGSGGDVKVSASNSIQLIGASPVDPLKNFSVIAATAAGSSNSGNITLSTNNLLVKDGGSILSETFGQGASGNIYINSSQSVTVRGSRNFAPSASVLNLDTSGSIPSAISSSSYAQGKAGNLSINTLQLYVLDGASVSSSTVGSGAAGNISIIAPELVKISGFVEARGIGLQNIFPSLIASSGIRLDPLAQILLGLSEPLSGNAGNISIDTGSLIIEDMAQLTVRNDGLGNAGTLKIDAKSIYLDNQAGITASTQSGQGGNIEISSDKLLLMRRNSQLSTSAGNAQTDGDGGQLNINTNFIVATPVENSDITANAFEGRGGNINITAQGIFGLESRLRLTPLSDITASSELGIDGSVEINALDFQTLSSTTLPQEIVQTPEITSTCQPNSNTGTDTFTLTGTGGIPPNPDDILSTNSGWYDRSTVVQSENKLEEKPLVVPPQILEAQGWRKNSDGTIVLTTEPTGEIALTAAANVGCNQASVTKTDTNIKSRDHQ